MPIQAETEGSIEGCDALPLFLSAFGLFSCLPITTAKGADTKKGRSVRQVEANAGKDLEARVRIELTYKGFADRTGRFAGLSMGLF
jgi:hypothetical protein